MVKKSFISLLIISSLLLLASCGIDYRYSLDEKLHEKIEYVYGENDSSDYIIYNDDRYMYAGTTDLFEVMTYKVKDNYYKSYENDILLSWNGYRYIWYIDEYYSYTTDAPLFIYNERLYDVYFHEDYNYLTDTFVIEGTTSEIIWEDMFLSEQPYFDFVDPVRVVIYSKQCPRIHTRLELVCIEEQWYLSLPDSQTIWIPSDEFIKILFENGII